MKLLLLFLMAPDALALNIGPAIDGVVFQQANISPAPSLLIPRRTVLRAPAAAVVAAGSSLAYTAPRALAAAGPAATASGSSVKLSNGDPFPLASFGLQIYDDETAKRLTRDALDAGFTNFFASVLAGNQRGFARAIKESGVARKDVYICGSVVSNRAEGFDAARLATRRGWEQNLGAFAAGNIDHLDQIMLDYPCRDPDSIRGQWRAFEEMHAKGYVDSLAVSNFSPSQLDVILNDPDTTVKPVVNQLPYSVAYHPGSVEENAKRGVLVQAWAPLGYSLGRGSGQASVAAMRKVCGEMGAARYGGKSWAQVALRWVLQRGAAFTTQSSNKAHFVEYLAVFDFELSADDMAILDKLAG